MNCVVRLFLGALLLSVVANVRADLVPSPGQVDFGYQAVSTTSEPKATTLRNTGSQPLSVNSMTQATGAYARVGGTCGAPPFTIAAQSSCTLEHTFTPSASTQFPQTHTVTLAGGSTVAFGLYGQGDVGFLEISPMSLSFPPTPVGPVGNTMTATMNNIRSVPMVIAQMTTTSAPEGSFVRTGGTCPEPPFEVGGPGGCTVQYTFTPREVGPASGALSIVASSGTFVLFLSGDGEPETPLFTNGFEAATPVPAP